MFHSTATTVVIALFSPAVISLTFFQRPLLCCLKGRQETLDACIKTHPEVERVFAQIRTTDVAADPMPPTCRITFLFLNQAISLVDGIADVQLIPYLNIGAKHILSGYNHLLIMVGAFFSTKAVMYCSTRPCLPSITASPSCVAYSRTIDVQSAIQVATKILYFKTAITSWILEAIESNEDWQCSRDEVTRSARHLKFWK